MTDEESDGTRQKFLVFSVLLTNTTAPARTSITVLAHRTASNNNSIPITSGTYAAALQPTYSP